jgi:hypothetical protein
MWQKKCGRKTVTKKVLQKKCIRKSAAGKVWKKSVGKCGRKTVAEKVCSRKIIVVDLRQQNHGKKTLQEEKKYGSHMCSVEFMNQFEGFPCKYVGCPLGSLWIVVELI